MLLITFSRAASQELRERVRRQIVDAVVAFDDPSTAGDNQLIKHLLAGTEDQLLDRKRRLRDALAGFDAATIATTHQFCQLVLKSLGVAGDTAANVTLLESLDDLIDRDRRRSVPGPLRTATRRSGAGVRRRAGIGARGGQQPGSRAAATRPGSGFCGRRPSRLRRKSSWQNWKSASGVSASSATTTC